MLDFLAKVLSCGKLQGGDLELFITALLDVAKDIAVYIQQVENGQIRTTAGGLTVHCDGGELVRGRKLDCLKDDDDA